MKKDKREIQPICKTCHYRRIIEKTANINMSTYWEHTACFYCHDTGELRGGRPQGDYCPNYLPKGSVFFEYGRSEDFLRGEKQNE
jgi:hypothetical protein